MKIHQLSIFLENKPGHLQAICQALADAQINIVTLSLADTQQFGIVRLIVEDWQKAKEVLSGAGYAVNIREVVAATVPDKPGGMVEILKAIGTAGVNIEYMYAFANRSKEEAILVFRFQDADAAITALQKAGREVLSEESLFSLSK